MSSSGSYATCLADFSADASNASDALVAAAPTADALLRCVVAAAANAWAGHPDAVRDAFFLLCAASLVFFMQMGFAMICAGCVWVNKVQNTLLKSFLDACGAPLGFYTAVHAFVFGRTADGPTTFIGSENFFLVGFENNSFWLFQFAFCATSTAIVGQVIICAAVLLLLSVGGACQGSSAGLVRH
jgi:hypothetical protein